jgi:hypothetical protein
MYKALLLIPSFLILFTASAKETFKKEFDKSYTVDSNVLVDLHSGFSEVTITNGSADKVQIHVEVLVDAKSEQEAQKLFNKIEVVMTGAKSKVTLKTEMDGDFDNDDDWSIKITISMPSTGGLNADQSFGSLKIQEIRGESDIHVSYGSLKASKLSHAENKVKVSFGEGEIDHLGGGDITVEFGSLDIDRLTASSKLKCGYGELDIDHVDSSCKNLTIDNEFGNTKLSLASGSGYTVEGSSSFGSIDLPSSAKIITKDSDWTSESIKATFGSGSSGGLIKLSTSFGDIEIDID